MEMYVKKVTYTQDPEIVFENKYNTFTVDDEKYPGWDMFKMAETYRVAEEIFDGLTDEATIEIFNATTDKELKEIYDIICEESFGVLYGKRKEYANTPPKIVAADTFGYLDKLTENVDETFKKENLLYFITSVLPNFELNWHHIQWAEISQKIKRFAILAARDHGKCEKPDTKVLMYDGSIKMIKDVKVGDYVMGPDSKKRKVLHTHTGKDEMFEIKQYRGDTYTVNSKHTLTLFKKICKWNSSKRTKQWVDSEIVDIDLKDYLSLSERKRKNEYYGFKVCSEFKEQQLPLNPYFLGIWLGDGGKEKPTIHKTDKEIYEFCKVFAEEQNVDLSLSDNFENGKKGHINFVKRKDEENYLRKLMKDMNLLNNKHIPEIYFKSSVKQRLQLLAGLIDTDGHLWERCYYISQVNENIGRGIKRLCDSLGFNCQFKHNKRNKKLGNKILQDYETYSCVISGDLYKIPCKIGRRKVKYYNKKNHKEVSKIEGCDITVRSPLKVTSVGIGDYVGITLDGDGRFVLGDGTVTHNSFFFSNALPIWYLYRFSPNTKGVRKNSWRNNSRGFLFSFSISQAIDLLTVLKDTIESSDVLREKLFNKQKWNNTDITCLNKARLTVKGFGSSVRGAHPGWIIVDDPLKDNVLSSKEQRNKGTSYFHSVIMNMPPPDGPVSVVGCVAKNTWILTDKGLEQIVKLSPDKKDLNKKSLKDCDINVFGKNNVFNKAIKFWNNGLTNTIKITTENRYELEGSKIHPVMKVDTEANIDWCKLKDLKVGDYIIYKAKVEGIGRPIKIKGKFFKPKIDKHFNECTLPEYVNEDLAYLLGLWVAEGSNGRSERISISATEKEITDFLSSEPFGLKFRVTKNNCWRVGNKEFFEFMKWMGVEKGGGAINKRVPYKIMQAEKKVVANFISGFFDGDGGTRKDKGWCGCSSISKELIEQIRLLLLHYFGIEAIVAKHKPGVSKRAKGKYPIYQLKIRNTEDCKIFYEQIGFRLKRKQIAYENLKDTKRRIKIPWIGKSLRALSDIDCHGGRFRLQNNETVSFDKLKKAVEYYKNICPESDHYKKCVELYNYVQKGFRFIKIRELEYGKQYTYDFVVPETNSFISNGFLSHNTPFHSSDLYGDLKTKKGWKVFEFPGIYPDGKILWPNRWNFDTLIEKRESQGNLIFTREILCKPITNESSIFPINILNNALYRMEKYVLVKNRASFPVKFNKVVVGCDFSISGNVGADWCVFGVFGIDDMDRMWLIHLLRFKGLSYHEQMANIKRINSEFLPDLIVMEDNVFQQIYVDESRRQGLPVVGNTTTSKKNDLREGWPGLAIDFERGMFLIPWGDQYSEDMKDLIISEFGSITYTDSGLQSTSENDDIVSMYYHAKCAKKLLLTGSMSFGYDFA